MQRCGDAQKITGTYYRFCLNHFIPFETSSFFCINLKKTMLCESLWTHIISFSEFTSALKLREVTSSLDRAWRVHARNMEQKEVYPSRTMININRCMSCNLVGDDMQIVTVPWSVYPPKSVFVCCKGGYCKYYSMKSLIQRRRCSGSRYHFLTQKIFPKNIQIPRSDGRITTAQPTSSALVEKKDKSIFIHTSWLDKGNVFEKCVLLAHPLIQKQMLSAPKVICGLWGIDHDPLG